MIVQKATISNAGWTNHFAVGDVDNDGARELVYPDWHNIRIVRWDDLKAEYRFEDYWQNVSGEGFNQLLIEDVNGDGLNELIALQRGNWTGSHYPLYLRIYQWNGNGFIQLWFSDEIGQIDWDWQSLSVGNVDTDVPFNDLVVSTRDGQLLVYQWTGVDFKLFHQITGLENDLRGTVVGDFDGDGKNEIMTGRNHILYIYGYDSAFGGLVEELKLDGNIDIPGYNGELGDFHWAQALDIDGDGRDEALFSSSDWNTGDRVRELHLNPDGTVEIGDVMTPSPPEAGMNTWDYRNHQFSIGDLDGDGEIEIGIHFSWWSNTDSQWYNRLHLWRKTANGFQQIYQGETLRYDEWDKPVALVDLNPNSKDEIYYFYQGDIYVYEARLLRVDNPTGDVYLAATELEVSGRVDTGATLTVNNNGTAVGPATIDGSGNFSLTLSLAAGTLIEGANQIEVAASKGAETEGVTHNVTIDNTAPQIDATADPRTFTTLSGYPPENSKTAISYTLGEDADRLFIKILDGNQNQVKGILFGASRQAGSYSFDWNGRNDANQLVSEGAYKVSFTVTDLAGNQGTQELLVWVDNSPPTVPTITGVTSPSSDNTVGQSFHVTGQAEAGTTVAIYFGPSTVEIGTGSADDNGDYDMEANLPTGTGPGSYQIKATAKNVIGESDPSGPFTIVADTTVNAPTAITYKESGTQNAVTGPTNVSPVDAVITSPADSDLASIKLTLDGISLGTQTAGFTFSGVTLSEGSNAFEAIAMDIYGNTDSLTDTLMLDTIAPSVQFTNPSQSDYISNNRPAISAAFGDGSGSGIDTSSIVLQVNGVEVTGDALITATGLSYTPLSNLADGAVNVAVDYADRAGNSGSTGQLSFVIDTVPPNSPSSLEVLNPADGMSVAADSELSYSVVNVKVLPEATTADDVDRVELFSDGVSLGTQNTVVDGYYSFTAISLDQGSNVLTAVAIDQAGNSSGSSSSFNLFVDSLGPTILIQTPNTDPDTGDLYTNNPKESIVVTVADDGKGVDETSVEIRVNGNAITKPTPSGDPASYTYTYTPATSYSDGTITVTVNTQDLLGTAANQTQYSFEVDTAGPTVQLSYQPGSPVKAGALEIMATADEPLGAAPTIDIDQPGSNDIAGGTMTTVDAKTYSYTYTTNPADGTHYLDGEATVTVAGADRAGNAIEVVSNNHFLIDTTPPEAPQLDFTTYNINKLITDFEVRGHGALANGLVRLYITWSNQAREIQDTVADAEGRFAWPISVTVGKTVVEGTTFDSAGNESPKSPPGTIQVTNEVAGEITPTIGGLQPEGVITQPGEIAGVWTTSAVRGDADNDGTEELVFLGWRDIVLTEWDELSGKFITEWYYQEVFGSDFRQVLVEDVNGDGLNEVIILQLGDWNGNYNPLYIRIFAWNGNGFNPLWFSGEIGEADWDWWSLSVGDVDATNPYKDIVVSTRDGKLLGFQWTGVDFALSYQVDGLDGWLRGTAIGDFDGDGQHEIITGSNNTLYLYGYNSNSGQLVEELRSDIDQGKANDFRWPKVIDIDGDGRDEVLYNGSSWETSERIWELHLTAANTLEIGEVLTPPPPELDINRWDYRNRNFDIGDIDGDGAVEIGINFNWWDPTDGQDYHQFYLWKRTTNGYQNIYQGERVTGGGAWEAPVVLADLNRDGKDEVYFLETSFESEFLVYESRLLRVDTPSQDGYFAATELEVSGRVDTGATLTVNNNGTAVGPATIDGSGSFSLTLSLADGTLIEGVNQIEVTASKGTETEGVSRNLTVDTTAPEISATTDPRTFTTLPDYPLEKRRTTVNYTLKESVNKLFIKILDGNQNQVKGILFGASQEAGNYSFDWNGRNDANQLVGEGVYKVAFTATDLAGNSGTAEALVGVSNSLPGVPTITGVVSPGDDKVGKSFEVNGQAEIGTIVTILFTGVEVGTEFADETGGYLITVSLPEETSSGEYQITARAENVIGKSDPSAPFAITVDADVTPPQATVYRASGTENVITTPTNVSNVDVIVTPPLDPDLESIELLIGGVSQGVQTQGFSYSGITLTEGTNVFEALSKDIYGNTNRLTDMLLLDTVVPTVQFTSPAQDIYTSDAQPTLSATFDDGDGSGIDTASVQLTVNGSDVTGEATITETDLSYAPSTPLSDGIVEVSVAYADLTGNSGVAGQLSFIVDTIPPGAPTALVVLKDGAAVAEGSELSYDLADIQVTPDAATAGDVDHVELFLDRDLSDEVEAERLGTQSTIVDGDYLFQNVQLNQGNNYLYAVAQDVAGNRSAASAVAGAFFVDSLGPTILIQTPNTDSSSGDNATGDTREPITVTVTDEGKGVDESTVDIQINGISITKPVPSAVPFGYTYEYPPDEPHTDVGGDVTVTVYAVDLGGLESSEMYTFFIAPSPIVDSSTHPDQTRWYGSDDVKFSWQVPVDNVEVEGYSYRFDQSEGTVPELKVNTTSDQLTFTDVENGISYLHLRVKYNQPGAWSDTIHYRVKVDGELPHSEITAPEDGFASNTLENVEISGTAFDNFSGLQKVEISLRKFDDAYWNGSEWVIQATWLESQGTEAWSYTLPMVPVEEGEYWVRSRAWDQNGNIEDPSEGVKILIDTTPPQLGEFAAELVDTQLTVGLHIVEAHPQVLIQLTVEDEGGQTVDSVETTITEADYRYQQAVELGAFEGMGTIYLVATDNAGNASLRTESFVVENISAQTGGTVKNEASEIEIAAGALDTDVMISITPKDYGDPESSSVETQGLNPVSSMWRFYPDGLTFSPDKPAKLTLAYDPKQTEDPTKLAIYFFTGDEGWQFVGVDQVDTELHTVTVSVDHFSDYAVLVDSRPPEFVEVGIGDERDFYQRFRPEARFKAYDPGSGVDEESVSVQYIDHSGAVVMDKSDFFYYTDVDEAGEPLWIAEPIEKLLSGDYTARISVADRMGNLQTEEVPFVVEGSLIVVNGPNPVGWAGTTFYYSLPQGIASAKLRIYNVSGALLFEDDLDPMGNEYPGIGRWELRDNYGRSLANGLYIYLIVAVDEDGNVIRSEIGRFVVNK
ncbi:MAG: Ig-like domain-containing protein [Candidatus Bipolaricaulia bacterium]